MSSKQAVRRAIARAERVLPGTPRADGDLDPRWQAILEVAEFVETRPEIVWDFARKWGRHEDADLRTAVATCLLEHLLEHHFASLFPRVRRAAMANANFAEAFDACWWFGQSTEPKNAARIERLRSRLRSGRGTA